jgi:hypothetical protein
MEDGSSEVDRDRQYADEKRIFELSRSHFVGPSDIRRFQYMQRESGSEYGADS